MKRITNVTLSLITAALILASTTLVSAQSRSAQSRSAKSRSSAEENRKTEEKRDEKERDYVVYIDSVEVAKTKASGHEWDNNVLFDAPDLRVEVMRRDAVIERRIATLERQASHRRLQHMSEQFFKDGRFDRGERMGGFFEGRADTRVDLLAWQEAEMNDPQLQKIQEELADLRDRIVRSTPVANDTFQAQFGVQLGEPTVEVAVGDTVKLTVWDDDIAVNDLIGHTTLRITKTAIERGSFQVQCGKVISLRFKILPVEYNLAESSH